MWHNRILRYSTNSEPITIGTPQQEEVLDEETLARISMKERNVDDQLADAVAKSKRADDLLRDAQLQSAVMQKAAKDECDAYIAETREQMEAEAKKLYEETHQKAYDEGFKEGHEEGVKKGRDDGEKAVRKELANTIKQANDKAQKTIQDAKEQTAEYFIRAEDDVAKVVMLAIEKILPQHFLDVPQVVLPVVREAIKHVRDQKEVKIHVEPNSYDLILMARAELQSMLTDGTAILEVVSDDTLKPGDCVVETPNGGVDARLLTQIELMKDAVKSVMNN